MVLNGDIVEYENIGPVEDGMVDAGIQGTGVEYAAIELLINFMEYAWIQWSAQSVMRLNGGGFGVDRPWRPKTFQFEKGQDFVQKYANPSINSYMQENDYHRRKRKIVKGVRRYGPYVVASGVAAYAAPSWKDVGYEKRWRRKLKKLFPKNDEIPDNIFQEEEDPLPFADGDVPMKDNVRQTQPQNNIQMNQYPQRMRDEGRKMLDKKFSLTRTLTTTTFYEMSIILKASIVGNHFTGIGNGPHLYSTYISTTQVAGSRYPGFNWPDSMDCGTSGSYKGVGLNHTVYVFAADYPFLTMNPDVLTQDATTGQNSKYLSFQYKSYDQSTDHNMPVQLSQFITNKDWSYFFHKSTKLTFDMTNTSNMPYCVEILFFKFKADVDAMDYRRQALAVMRKQEFVLQEYINKASLSPVDIEVIYRKRIMLRGLDNRIEICDGTNTKTVNAANCNRENSRTWSYTIKRKYVIKRPILTDYETSLTDAQFFNTYYDRQKGTYCRVQAWTLEGNLVNSGTTSKVQMFTYEDLSNKVGGLQAATELGYGVNCFVHKTTKFKLDENIYKSYAPS